MDRNLVGYIVHGFAKSRTWLSDWASVDKAMTTHSSTLAWKIPWMEEPGRLQSMGSLRVGQDRTQQLHFHFSLSCTGEGNGNPLQCSCLENPTDGKPGGLPSTGSHRVGHNWSNLAAAAYCSTGISNICELEKKNYIAFPRMWEREKPLFSFKFNDK